MANFDQYLLELERELNELKTVGLRSSSSLAVAVQSVTITQQIVGYDANFHNDNCASQSAAIIELIPSDGKIMLSSVTLKTGANSLTGRSAILLPTIKNGHNAYEFRFASGSAADLTTIQGGGSIPEITLELEIQATSEFTTSTTYRQDH